MIQEIQAWQQDPVYWTGVELYEKYGESSMLKRMFAGSGSAFNKKRLTQELEVLVENALADQAQQPVTIDPPAIQELKAQASSLMDERSALKEQARLLIADGHRSGEKLKTIAHQLAFGIKSQLDGIFGRIQYAQVNGSLPHVDTVASLSIAEMIRRRNTLRTYMSRGTDPGKIDQWKAELFELDLKIKQLDQ